MENRPTVLDRTFWLLSAIIIQDTMTIISAVACPGLMAEMAYKMISSGKQWLQIER